MKLNEICVEALHSSLRTAQPGGNDLDFYSGGFGSNLCRGMGFYVDFFSPSKIIQQKYLNEATAASSKQFPIFAIVSFDAA
jgi:hypothetical protein